MPSKPNDIPDLTKTAALADAAANDVPIIGASGDLWAAPARTAKPAIKDAPPATWTRLGLVGEDGVAFGNSRDTADIMVWQSLYAARRLTTSVENTLKFAMASWSRASMSFAFAGGAWSGDAAAGYTYTPPAPGSEEERAVLLRWVDGTFSAQIYLPRTVVSENEDLTLKRDEGALLGVTVAALGEAGAPAWQFDSLDARFAPPAAPDA
ncbi:hypothetical protein AGRA3207_000171 [Actinomadura graeca]|uniref:Phage tail protein n=1 Tax=Actinomadura graeca TaxID=2750812 RepID=A0ABX8QNC2_9ACTN|nr:hypothetical protein [Actinomadura graeca]QXJ19609.1 hypothetical protein AGRA3207_000171 [Actinomadura graeca]